MVTTVYGDGTRTTFQYDAVSNRTTMIDSYGTTTYAYSSRNEVIRNSTTGPYVITYAYDAVGNLTTMIDPDGGTHTYTYDAMNRLVSQVHPSGKTATMMYDADSRLTTFIAASGQIRTSTYDPLGRVITEVDNVTVVDTYNAAGLKIVQSRAGSPTTYVYDNADRLTNQQLAGAFATFTMDAVGNITVKHQEGTNPMTMTYNAGNRLLTMGQGTAVTGYTFDNNGNMTAESLGPSLTPTVTTYVYDRENRLSVQIAPDLTRTTMVYDGDSLRRVKLSVDRGTTTRTTYVWDGSDYLQERT